MRPTITSEKHIVQQSLAATAAGAVSTTTLLLAEQTQDITGVADVRVGSTVKAIYIEMWIRGSDAGVGSTYIYILEKASTTQSAATAAEMALLGEYANKKNILFTSMGLINDDTSIATPVLRQWIKIPKGKQRFGLGDKLRFSVLSQTGSQERCGFAIYKEYY